VSDFRRNSEDLEVRVVVVLFCGAARIKILDALLNAGMVISACENKWRLNLFCCEVDDGFAVARDLTVTARTLTMRLLRSGAQIAWPTGETKIDREVLASRGETMTAEEEPKGASGVLMSVGAAPHVHAQAVVHSGLTRAGRAEGAFAKMAEIREASRAARGLEVPSQIKECG